MATVQDTGTTTQGCRYYYTSHFPGPNRQTTGYGEYQPGEKDPEGRICTNGWWELPDGEDGDEI
ncbi:MAG: hypothetical protein ACRDTG_13920 [Pseudonocardiaceae bacterium]